ncbi:HIPL1 protein-like [Hibiscus syriacus]|uniref:HIPL1 protein-like n=1 Tax=Hibiscus syriacus TaxID=106335 RepID=A0A6A3AWL0_HIBSY|nr:HIPL1 protein-like [Hibiscus syriacus]
MSLDSSPSLPIPPDPPQNDTPLTQSPETTTTDVNVAPTPIPSLTRSSRPSRACTIRASQRLYAQQQLAANERRQKEAKKEQEHSQQQQEKQTKNESDGSSSPQHQCLANSKIVTPLVAPPEPSQLPRWTIRSMWELASVLHFLHVFRPLLNIAVEFSAEEFETALITPNDTLADIHMPLMKAIPPVTRMPLTRDTWITVLCRKLRDWWHWVADGDLPIVASHGAEIEVYKSLDPGVRVVIFKALCGIRVEKQEVLLVTFCSKKTSGATLTTHLNMEFNFQPFVENVLGVILRELVTGMKMMLFVGHRLYREIRKVELKKAKMKGSHVPNSATYLWETVATNLEEFQDVSEKLFASKNRSETSLGKKLKNTLLPEIEKEHKEGEVTEKVQILDDYDRSINEAIKITMRKAPSPDPLSGRDFAKPEPSANGKLSSPSHGFEQDNYNIPSPKSSEYDDFDDNKSLELDRSNRRRQRPQRYSVKEFVEAVSDNEADFDSDDDIVGEAVYDDEYLRKRKQRRQSSSSEGDEEYHWDEENAEDEEEEEEDSFSINEDSDEAPKVKKLAGRARRETKLRSVDELQSGLRRSKRSTRNRINYRQYELSDSETEAKPEKANPINEHSDASENDGYSEESKESNGSDDDREMKVDPPMEEGMEEGSSETMEKEQSRPPEQSSGSRQDGADGERKPRFLDLNELAPSSGVDDSLNTVMKDDDNNDF